MSVSDDLMYRYYELVSAVSLDELREDQGRHRIRSAPSYGGEEAAGCGTGGPVLRSRAKASRPARSSRRYSAKRTCRTKSLSSRSSWEGETMKLAKIMAQAGVAKSNSEARRLIQQGAVEVDQKTVTDVDAELSASGAVSFLRQVGKKRFVQVVAEDNKIITIDEKKGLTRECGF